MTEMEEEEDEEDEEEEGHFKETGATFAQKCCAQSPRANSLRT